MTLRIGFIVLGFACVACWREGVYAQGIPCHYEVAAVIQAPDGPISESPTYATAISPNGRYVVGRFNFDAVGQDRAFVFDTQTQVFQALPLPGATTNSFATDVTDDGVIVGHVGGSSGNDFGFIYPLSTGQYTLLPPLWVQGGVCWITGINASGTVCGHRTIAGAPGYPSNAFIWSEKDGFTDLGLIDGMTNSAAAIANDGIVAVVAGFGLHAFTWDGRAIKPIGILPDADSVSPHGIANGHHVAGTSLFISGTTSWAVPWEFREGVMEALPVLPAPNTSCTALEVANTGLIIGGCKPVGTGDWRPCQWLGGQIRDVELLMIAVPGLSIDAAAAVGDHGTIVCGGRSGADLVSLVLQPVKGKPGDTNCDQAVNIDDLLMIIQSWGPGPSFADINGDRIVDLSDLLIVIDNWSS